jgi:hypothetical protein
LPVHVHPQLSGLTLRSSGTGQTAARPLSLAVGPFHHRVLRRYNNGNGEVPRVRRGS